MENYIVRIYSRDKEGSDKVTGILESVERQTRQSFLSLDALRSMLHAPATADSQHKGVDATPHARHGALMMSSKRGQQTGH